MLTPGRNARHLSLRSNLIVPVAFVLLNIVCGGTVYAQATSGTVRISGVATAPGETSVVLVDTSGTIVSATRARDDGHYTLLAPHAGVYQVRARRIGFLPDSSSYVRLKASQSEQVDLLLHVFPTQLARIGVEETRRCTIAPEAGASVFRLWQEAQNALTATVVTSRNAQIGFTLRRFERKLDPNTGSVIESRSWNSRAVTFESYTSIPAESLAAHGFVVPQGTMLEYYAPDARTLTSDAFARTHCFHPTEDKTHLDLIGLAFEPTARRARDRTVREVSGTLWFDRSTLALRTLEFSYAGTTTYRANGSVEYERLPNEEWIVNHWIIRMPAVVTSRTLSAPNGLTFEPGGITLSARLQEDVVAVWEAGGDVVSTFALTAGHGSQTALPAYGIVRGSVVDTTSSGIRRGIRDVLVTLRPDSSTNVLSTVYSTRTDSTGNFVADSVAPGNYIMAMSSGLLDTLMVNIGERVVRVEPATQTSLLTILPTVVDAIRRICQNNLSPNEMLLHGIVRDVHGLPIPHARVTVSWFDITDARREHFTAGTHSLATFTGNDGEYSVCGIPLNHALTIAATDDAVNSPAVTLAATRALIGTADIQFARAGTHSIAATHLSPGTNATPISTTNGDVRGTVHDSAGRAIVTAMFRMDSTAWTPVTHDGLFAISRVPPGRHVLEARALGYYPHAWYVNVLARRSAVANLVLQRVTTLHGVAVVARADTSVIDPTGFTERRHSNSGGYYLGATELAQRSPQRVSDILRSLPGVELHPVSNQLGSSADYIVVMRGTATVQGEVCPIQFYVDGHPFPTPDNVDRLVSPKEINAIEVYAGASQVPSQFNGPTARCGVIVIWTRDWQR